MTLPLLSVHKKLPWMQRKVHRGKQPQKPWQQERLCGEFNESLRALKECFKRGMVSKEDFAAALRAHQAAVDATKSPQREAAEKESILTENNAYRASI